MPKSEELLRAYLFKDHKKSLVYISDSPKAGYSEVLTKYRVLSFDAAKNLSVLDVELITGRTHQIRAHLAHIGHPIIGDGKYGMNDVNVEFFRSSIRELTSSMSTADINVATKNVDNFSLNSTKVSTSSSTLIMVIFMIFIPVILVGAAVIVYAKRKNL